jgi:uncharacterized repeat protein (TIGR01451 family)
VALLAVAGMALLAAAALAPAAQARVEKFEVLTPSPVALTSVATDPGTGLIYAQENEGESFFVYDPRTNSWSELTPSPVDSGNNGGAAYLDGKIYTSYTEEPEMGIYDIATSSWTTITNPLSGGTGDITVGNGQLYLANEREFIRYDPATGITTPLAEAPAFDPGNCYEGDEGFEPWGGLQFDGEKIYGHQGNGCRGFAVFDVAGNSWTELATTPAIDAEEEEEPGGPVLGSALDPITNTYLAYGPYEQAETLYRYDIEEGSWSTSPLSFGEETEIDDGGMAYVSLPGYEGVYMIEGEDGTRFGRYTEQNQTDLAPSISASVVASSSGGEITYSIQAKNNGPERAGGVVLSDSLPSGTTLLSVTTSQGSCGGNPGVSCALGGLRNGAAATATIKVKTGLGAVTNTAKVSSQALDTNPGNDSATLTSTVAAPVRCVVPKKLRDRRLKGAKKALRAAHCKPGKLTHRYNPKVKKGRVIRVAKKAGKSLPAGTKVNLTVSTGPKRHKAGKPKHR